MITIACVLKSGGEYAPRHVYQLQTGFVRHAKVPFNFVCLSDLPGNGYSVIPLKHNWKGWWSKLELFRPGLFDGPVFFADLDTIVVGNVDELLTGHCFTVLENFWSTQRIGSGLMAWDCDLSAIYEKFSEAPERYMAEGVTTENWGDQGFIRFNSPIEPERFQRKHPGKVVSYKFHCKAGVPPEASIVCFHGKPRPWLTELWGK